MDVHASVEEDNDIDWDTEDELEIENIAVTTNVASSSAGPSNDNLVQHFIGMGFPEKFVMKAIKQNGESDTDRILESIFAYMGGHVSDKENDDINLDTKDDLEIQNIASTSCSTLVTRNAAIVSNGEASSSRGPSNFNAVQHFIDMGFPEELVTRAIKGNEENDTEKILETLLTYSQMSPEELNTCHASSSQQQCVNDDDLSSDYDESLFDGFSEDDSCSESEITENKSLSENEKMLLSLTSMGYTVEEASAAVARGPGASIAELTDMISAAQMAKTEAVFFEEEKPKVFVNPKLKRKMYQEALKRKKQKGPLTEEEDVIRLPKPMIGFGVPSESSILIHRTLPNEAVGPPFFYYENVALAPKGVWDTISRFLYDVVPEFVDSKYYCAAARKRGYVHNLPIDNRFPLLPLQPRTIHDALPSTRRWWPAWDKRTNLNCLQTAYGSAKNMDRLRKALEKWGDEPPDHVKKYVMDECRKWNLVWVGKNKLAPLEPGEVETLLGFPRDHTRGGGMSRTDRYKSLGNSFQVDTVAYHLSVLKKFFPNGINVLSLFSGIGGAEVALHRLGVPLKTVVSVEISKPSRDVVKSWWEQTNQKGNLIHLDDVEKLQGDRLEELIRLYGGFDLVVGGSPCNNLAGGNRVSRDGLDGDQSSLFFEYHRILDCVRAIMKRDN
nr:DNA (cytosine-5)-methyltransferase DRM2-like [Tanacetum cinerariifolium]